MSSNDLLCRALPGRYILLKVSGETYGIPILNARELVGMLEITRVPDAPPSLRGVVNLRGKVIPVIDLSAHLHMGPTRAGPHSVIVVLERPQPPGASETPGVVAVLVDDVLEVVTLGADQLEPLPSLAELRTSTGFFLGIGKTPNEVIFLLDVDAVLRAAEATPRPSSASPPAELS
jgi:purine-binding chemotaxis protein CheW